MPCSVCWAERSCVFPAISGRGALRKCLIYGSSGMTSACFQHHELRLPRAFPLPDTEAARGDFCGGPGCRRAASQTEATENQESHASRPAGIGLRAAPSGGCSFSTRGACSRRAKADSGRRERAAAASQKAGQIFWRRPPHPHRTLRVLPRSGKTKRRSAPRFPRSGPGWRQRLRSGADTG